MTPRCTCSGTGSVPWGASARRSGRLGLAARHGDRVLVAAAALATGALAQSDKDHAAHHPPGTSAPVAAASKAAAPGQVDMQMKSMQEMHEKMMSAKTPEGRQALMAEHMKTMQDGTDPRRDLRFQ